MKIYINKGLPFYERYCKIRRETVSRSILFLKGGWRPGQVNWATVSPSAEGGRRSLPSSRHFQLQMPLYPDLLLPGTAGNTECSGGNVELGFLILVSKHFKDEFAVNSSSTTEPQSFWAKNGQWWWAVTLPMEENESLKNSLEGF